MRTHSVVTSAVIAAFVICYARALPLEGAGASKVENATLPSVATTVAPAETTSIGGKEKTEAAPTQVPGHVNVPAANASLITTTPKPGGGGIPPEPFTPHTDPPVTTSTSTTTTTTTPKPTPTTPSTTTTSTAKPAPTTTPTKPTSPTTSTAKPTPTTEPSKPTTAPTAAPHHNDRKFDGPSFIGGIILACGLSAIGFVAFKFYKARTEHNYHTL